MDQGKRRMRVRNPNIVLCVCALLLFAFCLSTQVHAEEKDSCITCHGDPNFAAFNKKLRSYFLKWENSNHSNSGVTCFDCHGGNPAEQDKNKAHTGRQDSIYFTDIPRTCGKCHDAIYASFTKSYHYKYLDKPDILNMHGANCITCHSPGDAYMGMGANPEEVENACGLCHNYKTRNFPEIPGKAMVVLVKYNSIKQQFNNLIMRTDIIPTQDFISAIQKKIKELSAAWHSFDLKMASKKTDEVLDLLKKERKVLRKLQTDRIYEKGKSDSLYGN